MEIPSSMSNEEALDVCLRKCARVTKEKGFKYFTVPYEDSGLYRFVTRGLIGKPSISWQSLAHNVIYCVNEKPINEEQYFIDADNIDAEIIKGKRRL